ncbi:MULTISPECIES: alcohol dehydrogenase catalytic domain-containing protein [Sphingobium]|uniref:alcohol dehydrogenase catalytic domain-containing protein n=1 Tax=Sphingobium TaxID=165695 RepID=UPI00159C0A25|nr:NADH oxidase [Sphingobium sp. 15-1]
MERNFAGVQLRSTIDASGVLKVDLAEIAAAPPEDHELVVRVEAAPINPSDLALLFGPVDPAGLQAGTVAGRPALMGSIPAAAMASVEGRLGLVATPGNEGAGTVVDAGRKVREWIGRRVGMQGGGMYAQYRVIDAAHCMPIPDGATVVDGASMFVNPLTALCFVETMKAEGHKAIVHFAAASNLGQMLNRICIKDGIPLVNIVRNEVQASLLRDAGARWVLNSESAAYEEELADALAETGATLAFDPIAGGIQGGRLLAAMEKVANKKAAGFDRYGSGIYKQVYVYGQLDAAPIVIDRWLAYAWGLSGWLLTYRLRTLGDAGVARLRQRIADELTTTFASRYTRSLNLAEALDPDHVAAYARKATGEKYLIAPHG